MKYWLFKSEPSTYALADLKNSPGQTDHWDGIRNYQARNYIRDDMRVKDRVLFYHSNADPLGVAGTARIARAAYPDHTAWDKGSQYYDPRSTPQEPRRYMVDVRFEEEFPELLTLAMLRDIPELENMLVLRRGMRLSIQPVAPEEFRAVVRHARALGKKARAAAP